MKTTGIILHQPLGVLRLITDGGLEGHCTGVTATPSQLEDAASVVLQSDPVDRERTWRALKELSGGLSTSLRAGIDVALWDLSAKIAGRPLFRHVNGFRDRVPVCRSGSEGETAEGIVQDAKDAQQAGFKAYRIRTKSDESALVRLVRDVRSAVGPDFPLIFDGRNRYTVDGAIRIGRVLDEADYFYFDRPRPQGDHSGGTQVAGEIDTPTSTEVSGPMEASLVMTVQSADHIRTGVGVAGGFTDVLKSARCAEAFGAYCHLEGMGICDGFAHLHLVGALRNTPFIELTGTEVRSPFVRNPLRVTDGLVRLPVLPGLGIDIDLVAVMDHTTELIEI